MNILVKKMDIEILNPYLKNLFYVEYFSEKNERRNTESLFNIQVLKPF